MATQSGKGLRLRAWLDGSLIDLGLRSWMATQSGKGLCLRAWLDGSLRELGAA
ncbi:MAG: hypothetical protein AAFW00_19390 [Bacteroidota bacterium]